MIFDIVKRLRNPVYVNGVLDEAKCLSDMEDAAREIERLQSMAGAASEGQSFSDLKQSLRG